MITRKLADYHDAELVNVDAGAITGDLSLSFRLENGQSKVLTLIACEIVRVVDFVSQNVVSRIMIFCDENIDESYVNERLDWATSLSDAPSFLTNEKRAEIIRRIKNSDASLMILEPSCGAEIVALCCDVRES